MHLSTEGQCKQHTLKISIEGDSLDLALPVSRGMHSTRHAFQGGRNKQIAIEEKIDDLERRLKDRVEISSGFAEPLVQSRKMRQALQFYDTAGRGVLNYQGFFQAMTKFNLIGVQREVEALFNRYDEYLTGFVDYKEMALILYGLSSRSVSLNRESREIIYKMKATLVSTGGASGLLNFLQQVKQMEGIDQGGNFFPNLKL